MAERYYSVEIQEVSSRGTLVKKGVFPMSSIASVQEQSQATIVAAVNESKHCLLVGIITDFQLSMSLPYDIELTHEERKLALAVNNDKMSSGWSRHFYAPAVKGDV